MRRLALALSLVVLLASGCTSNGSPASPSRPSASASEASPGPVPPIPDGVYEATITVAEARDDEDPHVIALSDGLDGHYELTLASGHYQLTLDGKDTVPYRIPDRPGVEGGYIKYGYWVFRGVPPIGSGSYEGDASLVAFHSGEGACFQPGADSAILNGLYRWSLEAGSLTFTPVAAGDPEAEGHFEAGVDDCLGRSFVLSEHPWVPEG